MNILSLQEQILSLQEHRDGFYVVSNVVSDDVGDTICVTVFRHNGEKWVRKIGYPGVLPTLPFVDIMMNEDPQLKTYD